MADQASGSSATAAAPSGLRGMLFGSRLGLAGLLLRVALAVVMFPHGAQKAFGWWGGHGWNGTVDALTTNLGLPAASVAALIVLELVGPVALLFGFATRLVAAGFVVLMIGAIQSVHRHYGFFMNWFANQQGEGYEYHLLVIGIAAALVVGGAGAASIDRRLAGGR